MKDYPNARDCAHGQLRRACPICEAEARLAELQEAVRWGRECSRTSISRAILYARPWAIGEFVITEHAARAAVDALVGEG
jgi:hypothetical protein